MLDPALLLANDVIRHAVHLFRILGVDALPVMDAQGDRLGLFTKEMLYELVLGNRDLDQPVSAALTYGEAAPPRTTALEQLTAELETARGREAILDDVVDSGCDGLVAVDCTGRITLANRTFAGLFCRTPREMEGKHLLEVWNVPSLVMQAQSGGPLFSEPVMVGDARGVLVGRPLTRNGRHAGAVGEIILKGLSDLRLALQSVDGRERRTAPQRAAAVRGTGANYTFEQIVGDSAEMQRVKREARWAAVGDAPVLLLGPSGTGKELLAHATHNASPRRACPFVKVNCAAVPAELLESEFFGYESGAFTGARSEGKPGKFELAHGGTLFLDEIGDMSLSLQSKLLRVLQDGEFERIGGIAPRRADVRVIAATNRDITGMVDAGLFRGDLYYRLNVMMIQIPPLCRRREDIPGLAQIFLETHNREIGRRVTGVTHSAMRILSEHGWPGNVRELENVVRRAIYLCEGEALDVAHLPHHLQPLEEAPEGAAYKAEVRATERDLIKNALSLARGNRTQAAAALGMSRATLYAKIQRLGLPTHKS